MISTIGGYTMDKRELKKQLAQLKIPVLGNKIKASDIRKVIFADIEEDIKKAFKQKENKDWTVYELPTDQQSVNGLDTYQTFQHFCDNTKWEDSQDFWEGIKQTQQPVFVYVSKTKGSTDPLRKLCTIDNVSFMDAADNLVTEISGLGFPSGTDVQPAGDENKCTCDIFQIMREGCKCGHVKKLKEQDKFYTAKTKAKLSSADKVELKKQLKQLGIITKGNYIKKGDVEKLLKKAQAQCTVTAWEVNLQDRKKTFKDPKDPKITYTIKKTGISQGRGVYDIIYLVPRH